MLGRRTAKIDGLSGDVTRYVYDGWNVIEERSGATGATLEASFVYDERGLPVAMHRGGKLYFYQYNHIGSIEAVLDADGQIVEQYSYDPFGGVSIVDGSGNPQSDTQIDNPFMFAGQWRDSETGLYYMRHRFYSSTLGRFTSRDPLEYADSLNAYAYAMSNPVNFADPMGLSTSAGSLNTGAGNPMAIAKQWASMYQGVVNYLADNYEAGTKWYALYNTLMSKVATKSATPFEVNQFYQMQTEVAINAAVGMVGSVEVVAGGAKAGAVLSELAGQGSKIVDPGRLLTEGSRITDPRRLLSSGMGPNPWTGEIVSEVTSGSIGVERLAGNPRSPWVQLEGGGGTASTLSISPGNPANKISTSVIPSGTRIQRGIAAPIPEWGGIGGAEQIQILDNGVWQSQMLWEVKSR